MSNKLLMAGVMLAVFATCSRAQILNDFTATRTSGNGPLAVTFDASQMVVGVDGDPPSVNEWFYEYEFSWDFDDPGSGSYTVGNEESKNTATGPIAAHVFEPSGINNVTYTVTLTVTGDDSFLEDGIYTNTKTITVTPPNNSLNGGWGGSGDTVVISNTQNTVTGNWSGEPSGATRKNLSTWAEVRSELGASNKRILLRRGEEWDVDDPHTFSSSYTNCLFGSFGPGANPLIKVSDSALGSGDPAAFVFAGTDRRIMDLDFENTDIDTERCFVDENYNEIENLLLLRVEFKNFKQTCEFLHGDQRPHSSWTSGGYHGPVYMVDSDMVHDGAARGTGGQWQVMWSVDDSAVLGCSFQSPPTQSTSDGGANSRFMVARRSVFSNNKWWDHQHTSKVMTRWHAPEHDSSSSNSAYDDQYTEFVVVSGNYFEGDGGSSAPQGLVTVSQLNGSQYNDQRFRYFLFERNHIHSPSTGNNKRLLEISTPNHHTENAGEDSIHVRRNLLTRVETDFMVKVHERNPGITVEPRLIHIYHNTFYADDDDTESSWDVITVTDVKDEANTVHIHSNIANGPGIGSSHSDIVMVDVSNAPSGAVKEESNEVSRDTANKWFVNSAPVAPDHFKLASGTLSPPIIGKALADEPKLYEYDGSSLASESGALDLGCWER